MSAFEMKYAFYRRLSDIRHRVSGSWINESVRKLNLVFIHIPKAAGSSVSESIYGSRIGHHTYRQFQYQLKMEEFFVFSVVRDPYDRLSSAYTFLKAGGQAGNSRDLEFKTKVLGRYETFSEFVREWVNVGNNIYSFMHFVPQVEFLKDRNGSLALDYIARFERLDEDMAVVSAETGRAIDIKHVNKTIRDKPYEDYYDPELREIVSRKYSDDFSRLGYSR
jgi:hypothetical protein